MILEGKDPDFGAQLYRRTLVIRIYNAAGMVKQMSDVEPLLKVPNEFLPDVTLGSYTPHGGPGNDGQKYWDDGKSRPTSINALGLPNPGIIGNVELAEIVIRIKAAGKRARISIACRTISEWRECILAALEARPHVIELNFGCPNERKDGERKPILSFMPDVMHDTLTEGLHGLGSVPPDFAIKLSPYSDPSLMPIIAKVITQFSRHVRAVVTCNTFPDASGYDANGALLITANGGYGGLGGAYMKHIALGHVRRFRELLPLKIWLVGVGGVSEGIDVLDFKRAHVREVQVGTAFFVHGPRIFQRIAEEYAYLPTNS